MERRIQFGVQTPQQTVTFQALRETWKLLDSMGYDPAWLFDHFYPILSAPPEQVEARMLVGPVGEVRERISEYIDEGVSHFITIVNASFDQASIRLFAEEVVPSFRHATAS